MTEQQILIPDHLSIQIKEKLAFIYGAEKGAHTWRKLSALIEQYSSLNRAAKEGGRFSQQDVLLITYGDQLQGGGHSHLSTLHNFLNKHLKGIINSVHILPFYPYTSDDGFSVVDYKAVDPNLGDWEDVERLHGDFRIMFDAVVNHISASSDWFKGFLAGEEKYLDYFIVTDPNQDLSDVTRPRALPLLTAFQTATGKKYLWTTFSTDQIDLNVKNPEVLLALTEVLLFYVAKGADLIRMDAIGYLWKEIGTNCIHLPQVHAIVQLWRCVLDILAPDTLIITETNVPHKDNISYFGNGTNEAQLVYQFPLVPLVLHTVLSGDVTRLRNWAAELEPPGNETTFFNFLASHDGMGLVPARGLLEEAEVQHLVDTTLRHGGQVSYKNNPDGSQSPYELNITLFDALNDPAIVGSLQTKIDRFMVSQVILLSLAGVPGIYFHSLLGSSSWHEGFKETERARTLNREKLDFTALEAVLADGKSRAAKIFNRYATLISIRTAQKAFHPNARQQVLSLDSALFTLLRTSEDGSEQILVIANVSGQLVNLFLPKSYSQYQNTLDLLGGWHYNLDSALTLQPYQAMWLRLIDNAHR